MRVSERLYPILEKARSAGRGFLFRTEPVSRYWLARFLILRLTGAVYSIAFLILIHQGLPLLGESGLLPIPRFLDSFAAPGDSRWEAFFDLPSVFWLGYSDTAFQVLAWFGAGLSLVVLLGWANTPILLTLWFLYMSFVHAGQTWYSFGWEIQLLETGFFAAFLCPLWDPRPFPASPPPAAVIWMFRWLACRIYLGAGLIKLRGDACWLDLTCLDYHFESQPLPNPLSPWFHYLPHGVLRFGTGMNHFIQLVTPVFLFYPRTLRHVAASLYLLLQVLLMLSGNLSFLNWLTVIPVLACFDDDCLGHFVPRFLRDRAQRAQDEAVQPRYMRPLSLALIFLVAWLSVPVVQNLLSPAQRMNFSFNRLHLVNTYGAFGAMGKHRHELILEGTDEEGPADEVVWKEYEFKAKPGDPARTLPVVSPYHYRLDWQIWFAAKDSPARHPWLIHLVWKLLHNDPGALSLLANHPFPVHPPRSIRVGYYRYRMLKPGDPSGKVWERTRLGDYLKPISIDLPGFKSLVASQGWKPEG
ncbi:MAG: membrane protein [Nitrospinae bacterium CG11_big_fil_rev_8_21_14_0_20_56_8]|nr:MAG: membrane protein [Nitrospinae bacterium CG11_big_fil_rev_8_21_14_0_20_56_8]